MLVLVVLDPNSKVNWQVRRPTKPAIDDPGSFSSIMNGSSSATPSGLSAATEANPSPLPPRYEIRRLEKKHELWALAIAIHSNTFHSNLFTVAYPENKTKRFNESIHASEHLVGHQIETGLSFGVFDLEYPYKRAESVAVGGKFYWDPDDDEVSGEELLDLMDFPLVSIGLAHDLYDPLNWYQRLAPLRRVSPVFMHLGKGLAGQDKRDPKSWRPTGFGQVQKRNGAATKATYAGKGLNAGLQRWSFREARRLGFRGIEVCCLSDAANHYFSEPPSPAKAVITAEFNTGEYTAAKDENGNNPFGKRANQRITNVYIEL